MYYLIEGFKSTERRLDEPIKTQAVTIQQLAGAIIRMLESKEINLAVVTSIDEATFTFFYQERRAGNGRGHRDQSR